MTATALWHTDETTTELREVELANTGLKVRSLYSLISTGTERLVAKGEVPIELQDKMRVPGMQGAFSFPLTYGYSLVGQVEASGHDLHHKYVHLLHPHQSVVRWPAAQLSVIPEGIPPLRATLASNLETVVNAIWDGNVQIGDRVLVVGFGMIGALLCRVLSQIPALELEVVEKEAERRALATEMGFALHGVGGGFDCAFHTTAQSAGLQTALDAVGQAGRVVELSWYGTRQATLSLGGHFHYGRQQIISSQVSHLPAQKAARWDFARRKAVVFRLLKQAGFDQHITQLIDLRDAPAHFHEIRSGYPPALGTAIRY